MDDKAFETSWPPAWRGDPASRPPLEAGAAPKPGPGPRTDEDQPAEPPAPGPEQAPHEHPDDPGVHPDGPRRYHDDHATPARQSAEEGVPA
ncbi:hypothetical protein [Mitsuaria sp. GD03876]|uniref:hypothetical protein n=1 Tax=Mitsuaria sp. GD03876 TaxID=2975399 RepID=UPI00244A93F3|nr:hypothetical protein [Mitsuaria sp. GD03876]MDH0866098.1 hypothetical protein [Mitsuaria sp. GD03876]